MERWGSTGGCRSARAASVHANPDAGDMAADSRGKMVAISGHVCTWAERDAVVGATWMANGLVEVDDNLYITGQTAASGRSGR